MLVEVVLLLLLVVLLPLLLLVVVEEEGEYLLEGVERTEVWWDGGYAMGDEKLKLPFNAEPDAFEPVGNL